MKTKETLEEIEKLLEQIIEENKKVPVIVEGEKDIAALRLLGLTGEIISFNIGKNIADFSDLIASKYQKVILLTDWDRRGGRLCFLLRKNLEGRVKCDLYYREMFAKHSMTRTVEGLPSWLQTLHERVGV